MRFPIARLLFLAVSFLLLFTIQSHAALITLAGQDYNAANTPVSVSHGFKDDLFSTPVSFIGDQRYIRITADSLTGHVSPSISAGTFFTSAGYISNAELLIFKTGNAPKRASEVFVYDLHANAPVLPNGNPAGQVTSTFSVLHDFVIDTHLLAGPTSGFSIRLSVGEDYFNTAQADNSGFNSYRLDALTAVPEPSSLSLAAVGAAAAMIVARHRRRPDLVSGRRCQS